MMSGDLYVIDNNSMVTIVNIADCLLTIYYMWRDK